MRDAARDVEEVKRLVEAGHDVNQRDWLGRTPLMRAAEKGRTDCVEYLLQNGAIVDDMFTAARIGHLEVMKRLVEGGQDVNQRDRRERTPLMYAAGEGHTDCVEYLLQNGAQLDLKGWWGETALHLAAERGCLEVMKRLVGAGQDVNQRDGKEWTTLMEAAEKGHTDCVEYLIKNGAHFNMFDAAQIGMLDWLKRLVDAGQDVNQRDRKERTPLMCAAEKGHTDCVEYLIQNGAQLDLKEDGLTALHLAALEGHLEVMKRLLEAGQDVNQRGRSERTPLMWAANYDRADCVEYLLQNGAQLDLKDKRGNTALHLAADAGQNRGYQSLSYNRCVEYLIQNDAVMDVCTAANIGDSEKLRRLIEAGQDVNQRDGTWEKRTPLMWAAKMGRTDCVKYLIQNGAQLDLKDDDGDTALHLAAYWGHLEVMKRLLEAGQHINLRGVCARTPLMVAANYDHTDCVEYLLQNGAQPDLKDEYGQTAYQEAGSYSRTILFQTPPRE